MTITSNRRRFLQGSAVAGSAAALAACGQQSKDQQAKDAKKDAEKDAKKLPSTDWERADYEKVKDGGTLNLAVLQLPDNWNYNQANGALVDLNEIRKAMGAGMELLADEKGEVTINPDYVESAELTSEDPQIVTVKFNKKGVWSDGQPIVVADLIAQAKALSGQDPAFEVVSTVGWDQIKEIRQTDDEYTCEIEYATPYADWIGQIHPDIPQSVAKDAETFNKGFATTPTPSKGPFTVTNVDQTGGVVTLGRNDKWWGRAPKLETIYFKVVEQPTQPQAFAGGELDALSIGDGDTLTEAKKRKDAAIQKTNGLQWTHLTINVAGGDGVLGDVKVREAIARGINREAVAQAVVGPLESPVVLKNNMIFMPGQEGYEDSFGGLEFDQKKAEKILEDAGWKKDGDVRAKDGKKLQLSIIIPAEATSNANRAKQVMNDLNKIGFKVEIKSVPSDAYFDEYISPKSFDLVTFTWEGTLFPQSSAVNTYYPKDSQQNYTNLDDDETLKPLATAAKGELDEKKRLKATNEFSQKIAESYVVIPFYATPNIYGVKKGLVNYGASLFESVDYTQVGYTS